MTATATAAPAAADLDHLHEVPDVARRLGCADRTIYTLVKKGQMKCVRVGRLVRIPESAVREFIAAGGAR